MIVARLKHENVYDATLLATVTAVWTATPDYVESPFLRRLFRGALLVGAVAGAEVVDRLAERRLVAMAESLEESLHVQDATIGDTVDGAEGLWGTRGTTDIAADPPPGCEGPERLLRVLGPVIGAVTLGAAVGRIEQRIDDALAAALLERGVRLPYTVIGLCWAVVVLVVRLSAGVRRV